MISRSSFSKDVARALRQQRFAKPTNRRGLAEPASGSFQYQTGDSNGVKFASRDLSGPTTTLALVSKAGTRYQFLPGLAEGLEKYAFKNTHRRSALRIQRESELLGADLDAYHTRENLILLTKFLRNDLPYFAELLAEVATQTKYQPHEFHEEVEPQIKLAQKHLLASTKEMAINSAHALAFHRGLGTPLHPHSSTPLNKYLNADYIKAYATAAYAKPNFAIVANGADHGELTKWVGQFFADAASKPEPGVPDLKSTQTKYYGGEERIEHGSGNTMVLAFPGSSSFTGGFYKPELSVLASLLGGQTSIKWSSGFSLLGKATAPFSGTTIQTKSAIYSDAGLLYVMLDGAAEAVRGAAGAAVEAIKKIAGGEISSEDIRKARALAKFKELEHGQNIQAGLELTGNGLVTGSKAYQLDETAKLIEGVDEATIKKAAKSLLDYKASVSAVGDLYVLPYAEEIGLKV